MGTIINYKCNNCDFQFEDKDLIFYLNTENELTIETLNMENSKKMTKSPLSGYFYESYCPHCKNQIVTFVPEQENTVFTKDEIKEIILKETEKINDKSKKEKVDNNSQNEKTDNNIKIIFMDFKNTFYKERRNILEKNTCPQCLEEMSLVISKNIPCPKCGDKLEEII